MILILGGTTEGRLVAKVCDEAIKPYYYSTKGNQQEIDAAHAIRITGGMTAESMQDFCQKHNIKLLIDAAHPFAELLHREVDMVSQLLNIPVLRYERNYPQRDARYIWCSSYQEALQKLHELRISRLLALTGTNTIAKLKPFWESPGHTCFFRILNREESKQIAQKNGFPPQNLLYYDPSQDEVELFKELKPEAIITKESGESGGFKTKATAAQKLGIPLLVVERPVLPSHFISIYGENGLRKAIEQLLPSFFELKTGYTTGTSATAATKAALIALLSRQQEQKVSITLPNGEWVMIPIHDVEIGEDSASAIVIKDGGDDPDVTHGHHIVSTVKLNIHQRGIHFLQGKGVGTVTLPGLGIDVGQPAINKTPRLMMRREVIKVMRHFIDKLPLGMKTGIDITISVPNGEELARKTFNPRLGIVGGISIIGTSGIVKPFSSDAFIGAIRREMQVARALKCNHIVLNSGAKSERYVKNKYPELPSQAFIHYGNFIGEALKIAQEVNFEKITMGIMIGKAVKLAEGFLDTHSKKVVMNKEFLKEVAKQACWSTNQIDEINNITLARQLWTLAPTKNDRFFAIILQKCKNTCQEVLHKIPLELLLIDEDGYIFESSIN